MALSTPRLWTELCHISLGERHPDDQTNDKPIICHNGSEFIAWWKSRARNMPLALHLGVHQYSYMRHNPSLVTPEMEEHVQMLRDLVKSSRILSLDHNFGLHLDSWIETQSLSFPGLETFVSKDFSMIGPLNKLGAKNVPLLRHLHTTVMPDDRILPEVYPLWRQLTHICIAKSAIRIDIWFILVRQLINVESWWLEVDIHALEDVPPPPQAKLCHLKQMHMEFASASNGRWVGDRIFQNLELPSLTALRINSYLLDKDLNLILQATPAVKELHLGDKITYDLSDIDYTGIIVGPLSTASRMPKLEHVLLSLGYNNLTRFKSCKDWIWKIIKSPWLELGRGTNKIKTIEISLLEGEFYRSGFKHLGLNEGELTVPGVEFVLHEDNGQRLWEWCPRESGRHWKTNFFDLKFHQIGNQA